MRQTPKAAGGSKKSPAFARLTVDLICVTKNRRNRAIEWLKTHFTKVCETMDCAMLACDGEADHVHLLVAYPPKCRVRFGSVCPRHPWLKGLRGINNRGCIECQRERKRARRAKIGPKPRPLTPRQIARAAGELHYVSNKPCCHNHRAARLVSNGRCLVCVREAVSRHYHRRAVAIETLKQLGLSL
jgi:Transposase IS200 like